jgi:two-component system LytT family response regulator
MKLRCLIIDDKPLAIDLLVDYTKKVPFLELIATTNNPVEGLSMLQSSNIDLVFLDIQMPELSGLQFMNAAGPDYKVILTTAYVNYAIDGYEHGVVDYLLKPISFERFYRAVNKAFSASTKDLARTAQNIEQSTKLEQHDYLFVKTDSKLQKVNFADIIYVQSLQNYIVIYTITGKIMSLQPLKRFEQQLPENLFIRVHKSYIIAISQISHLSQNRIYMSKDLEIPVGETFKDALHKITGH